MSNISIYINGQPASFLDSDDFPLVFWRRAVNYREPGSRFGDTTYTLKLPLDDTNKRILGPLNEISQANKFRTGSDPLLGTEIGGYNQETDKRRKCVICENDTVVFSGRLVITSVDDVSIECKVISTVAEFADMIANKSLRDLWYALGAFEFKGWSTMLENISAQVQNLIEAESGAPYTHNEYVICFPLISRGNPFVPNKYTAGQVIDITDWSSLFSETISLPEGREILGSNQYKLVRTSSTHLSYQDILPCVYLVEIIKAIFKKINWRVIGSWIESEAAKRLVIPYSGESEYIYNWQFLARGEYQSPEPEDAIVLRTTSYGVDGPVTYAATIIQYAHLNGVQNDPDNYTYAYIQFFYENTVPLGGTVNLPNRFGTQILRNWHTYMRILPLKYSALDYSFAKQIRFFATHPLDNPNSNDNRFQSAVYLCPVDGIYSFQASVDIINLIEGELASNGSPVAYSWNTDIQGLRFAFGISRIPAGGEIPAFLDGEFTIRGDLAGRGAYEHLLAVTEITGPGTYSISSNIPTSFIEMSKGDAVCVWVSMTSPFGPENHQAGLGLFMGSRVTTDIQNSPVTGPYTPFNDVNGFDAYQLTAAIGYENLSFSAQVSNRPGISRRDAFGEKLQPGQNLPDIDQAEFLRIISKIFNLYFDVDSQNKLVSIDSHNEFYLPPTSAHNLTSKFNPITASKSPNEIPKITRYAWAVDDDDYLCKRFATSANVDYYSENEGAQGELAFDTGRFSLTGFGSFQIAEAQVEQPYSIQISSNFSPYTIVDNYDFIRIRVIADAPITVRLPASPHDMMRISVVDYHGLSESSNITVNGNGHLIDGVSNIIINEQFSAKEFVFSVDDNSWFSRVYDSMQNSWMMPSFATKNTLTVPFICSKDEFFRIQNELPDVNFSHNPRILQVYRQVKIMPADVARGIPIRIFDPNNYPNSDYNDVLTDHIELSFWENPYEPQGTTYKTLSWKGTNGLFELYYKSLMLALESGYEMECEVAMNYYDWLQMKINRPIYIDGNIYYLKEVKDYSPSRKTPTKITIIKR